MSRHFFIFPVMLALVNVPMLAQAEGFGINATRLIYPEGAGSISVTLRNTMKSQPYLVQAGVSYAQKVQKAAPFAVTPPLFRLEPQSINQVRIAFYGAPLPSDRESVFYFHATAIPASAAPSQSQQNASVQGAVQLGVGNIIKIFYRPVGLASSSEAAQKNLQFTPMPRGLKATNPSPYFISLASLKVGGQALALSTPETLMIAPFSSQVYAAQGAQGKVQWQTINDIGGVDAFTATLP